MKNGGSHSAFDEEELKFGGHDASDVGGFEIKRQRKNSVYEELEHGPRRTRGGGFGGQPPSAAFAGLAAADTDYS